ncbi:MAG: DinB family protein [Gemmatimonadaceae bacterium]
MAESGAPELLAGLDKIEKESATDVAVLRRSLELSGAAIADLLKRALAGDGRIKGFKPHAAALLGYLVSHESHDRGQIVLTLKQAGHPVDKKTQFGLWEWGVR